MADEPIQMFPAMDFSDLEDQDLYDDPVSEDKWTYMMDFRTRRLLLDEDGRPRKTKTYAEYLVQTAMKILNTERFRYGIYSDQIGVEKSEWPAWEDIEIKRDVEEALEAHAEIERAEVLEMNREGDTMRFHIRLTGTADIVETEVDTWLS